MSAKFVARNSFFSDRVTVNHRIKGKKKARMSVWPSVLNPFRFVPRRLAVLSLFLFVVCSVLTSRPFSRLTSVRPARFFCSFLFFCLAVVFFLRLCLFFLFSLSLVPSYFSLLSFPPARRERQNSRRKGLFAKGQRTTIIETVTSAVVNIERRARVRRL